MSRIWACVLVLTAACTPNVPPPGITPVTARGVDVTPAMARDRVAAALEARGLEVVRSGDGFLTLKGQTASGDPAWAACERVLVRDRNRDAARGRFEDARALRVIVIGRFATLGPRTNVSLDNLLVGQYVDSFVNLPFEQRCASTGGLEKVLLDAAERG